jgi:hypothetical protein
MNLENFKEAYLTVINEEIEETEVVDETELSDVDEETTDNEQSAADHFKMGIMALMGKMKLSDLSSTEDEMIDDLVASIISDLKDSMSGD